MRIKNWHKFQHFKDRRPPWVKLHRDIMDQRDIHTISDWAFRVLVFLWLLASEDEEKEGNLPTVDDIAFRLRCTTDKINKALQELTPFLLYDDIDTISDRYHVDEPETETEKRRDRDREETKGVYGEFGNVRLTNSEHAKLKDKFNGQCDEKIDALSSYLASTGKRYKSHYATILNWAKKDKPVNPFDVRSR